MSEEMNDDDTALWGDTLLPLVLEAIGEIDSKAKGVRLHSEYGMLATATLIYDDGSEVMRQLPYFGTDWVSAALHAPKALQAITVEIEKGYFAICLCQYLPLGMRAADLVDALKATGLD